MLKLRCDEEGVAGCPDWCGSASGRRLAGARTFKETKIDRQLVTTLRDTRTSLRGTPTSLRIPLHKIDTPEPCATALRQSLAPEPWANECLRQKLSQVASRGALPS